THPGRAVVEDDERELAVPLRPRRLTRSQEQIHDGVWQYNSDPAAPVPFFLAFAASRALRFSLRSISLLAQSWKSFRRIAGLTGGASFRCRILSLPSSTLRGGWHFKRNTTQSLSPRTLPIACHSPGDLLVSRSATDRSLFDGADEEGRGNATAHRGP